MADGVIQRDVEQRAPRRPAVPGRTIPRLTFAEQLVLWSARRMATLDHGAAATESEASACRRDVLTRVAGELGVALCPTGGPAAGLEAAEALERTLDVFASAGARNLRLNPMCCRFVSDDERLFLSFLAACQDGDCRHTAALLSWFMPPAAMRIAASGGAAFAAALQAAGYCLPQRLHFAADAAHPHARSAAPAAPPTLH